MNIPQISKPALYLFLLLSLLLPLPAYPLTNHPYTITEEQQAFGDMIQNFINEMDLKYGMTCTGDGSSKKEKVTSISLMLSAYRRASLEEAREIHIQAKERLVEMIQENPKIQSYLSVTPFPKKDIRLSIIYGPDSTFYYCDGTVAGTIEGQGQLYYLSSGVLKLRLIDLHEEPYEEGLKIVRNNPLKHNMHFHKDLGFEKEIDEVILNFIRKSYKKYKIQCNAFGGKMSEGIDKIELSFVRKKKMSIDEARKMQVDLTQTLLSTIHKSKTLSPHLQHTPFDAKHINIRVHFENGKEGLFNDGSLSRMLQQDGIIHYFNEKPPTEYVLGWTDGNPLFEETFEEAIANTVKNTK